MSQGALGVPYQPHSRTSRDAALLVSENPTKVIRDRQRIMAYVTRMKGATDKEIQAALKMEGDTERPRRIELTEGGWLKNTGERRNRSTVWGLA